MTTQIKTYESILIAISLIYEYSEAYHLWCLCPQRNSIWPTNCTLLAGCQLKFSGYMFMLSFICHVCDSVWFFFRWKRICAGFIMLAYICIVVHLLIDWFLVFNATFSIISGISWRPVLVVEETGVPGENHWPWASNW